MGSDPLVEATEALHREFPGWIFHASYVPQEPVRRWLVVTRTELYQHFMSRYGETLTDAVMLTVRELRELNEVFNADNTPGDHK